MPQQSAYNVQKEILSVEPILYLLDKPNQNHSGEMDVSMMPPKPTIPTRQYLDQTLVPILLEGLAAIAKERPQDPVEYLGNFLLRSRNSGSSNSNSLPVPTTTAPTTCASVPSLQQGS
ncbi:unnamed protein product [Darwinula stevensoni]|uniref:Protein dpy-30 homolog n=1 Tax=Darwinula stevensoni TaxID=69355 RepID=A0A7R9AFH5_9CRUS|nr:unnamed protein product [Darwinula stevensoni]CAG0903322.1 unnamed protein product [Darwinula stevensoni]